MTDDECGNERLFVFWKLWSYFFMTHPPAAYKGVFKRDYD